MGFRSRASLWLLIPLCLLGHVLLAAGLFGPAVTITPRMGELTPVGRALGIVQREETLSIFASTRRLFESGETFIAVVLTLASIVIPLAKLVVVNRALLDATRSAPITPWLARTSNLTKYSLTDVFVVAVFIVCFKSFPGGTEISHHWGLWAFAAAATLPWIIAFGLAPRRGQAPTCRGFRLWCGWR